MRLGASKIIKKEYEKKWYEQVPMLFPPGSDLAAGAVTRLLPCDVIERGEHWITDNGKRYAIPCTTTEDCPACAVTSPLVEPAKYYYYTSCLRLVDIGQKDVRGLRMAPSLVEALQLLTHKNKGVDVDDIDHGARVKIWLPAGTQRWSAEIEEADHELTGLYRQVTPIDWDSILPACDHDTVLKALIRAKLV